MHLEICVACYNEKWLILGDMKNTYVFDVNTGDKLHIIPMKSEALCVSESTIYIGTWNAVTLFDSDFDPIKTFFIDYPVAMLYNNGFLYIAHPGDNITIIYNDKVNVIDCKGHHASLKCIDDYVICFGEYPVAFHGTFLIEFGNKEIIEGTTFDDERNAYISADGIVITSKPYKTFVIDVKENIEASSICSQNTTFKFDQTTIARLKPKWIKIYDQQMFYSVDNTSINYYGIYNGAASFDNSITDIDYYDKYVIIGFEDVPRLIILDISTETNIKILDLSAPAQIINVTFPYALVADKNSTILIIDLRNFEIIQNSN